MRSISRFERRVMLRSRHHLRKRCHVFIEETLCECFFLMQHWRADRCGQLANSIAFCAFRRAISLRRLRSFAARRFGQFRDALDAQIYAAADA